MWAWLPWSPETVPSVALGQKQGRGLTAGKLRIIHRAHLESPSSTRLLPAPLKSHPKAGDMAARPVSQEGARPGDFSPEHSRAHLRARAANCQEGREPAACSGKVIRGQSHSPASANLPTPRASLHCLCWEPEGAPSLGESPFPGTRLGRGAEGLFQQRGASCGPTTCCHPQASRGCQANSSC